MIGRYIGARELFEAEWEKEIMNLKAAFIWKRNA